MRDDQLLMLAYYFPPIKSIGVVRNYNLAEHFTKVFSTVDVITTSNAKHLPKEEVRLSEKINIDSVFTFDYRSLFALRKKGDSPHLTVAQKENWLSQVLVKLLRSFPFNLWIGEGGFFYILNAIIKGNKKIRSSTARTILYSSFPTYSDHYIAYWLKRLHPKSVWVADFRDLHTDPIYKLVYWEKFQHWCNRRLLRKADLVTTVSQGLADQLQRYHPRVHVLMNGVKVEERDGQEKKLDQFTIVYTGSLFTDERDPRPLFLVLQELIQEQKIPATAIRFIYAGKDGEQMEKMCSDFQLQNIFENKGLIARKEALDLQKNAAINLLLTSSHKNMSGVLTGKLFEYLSAARPIVLLIKGERDEEFENIFGKLNAGTIAYNQERDQLQKLKAYIYSAFSVWQETGSLPHSVNIEELKANYSWEKSIQDLMDKIDQLNASSN